MLRAARAARGLSQAKAARLAGLSTRTITGLELGQVAPQLRNAHLLHKTFGIPYEAWLEPAGEEAA